MAHLLSGCKEMFRNVCSTRHNRIANYLYDQFKTINRGFRTYNNKLMEQHYIGTNYIPETVKLHLHMQIESLILYLLI